MADGLKVPEPPDKPGFSGVDSTARVCPACNQTFQGSFHEDCPSTAATVKQAPTVDTSIDDIPEEAKPFSAEPSRQLNHYILVKQVGRGGMGAVWKAWDRNLTRWVAIKFLLAQDAPDILRFQREAKLAARLRHPNIAAIYEVGQAATVQPGTNVLHYLAMEFIEGQSLQETKLPFRELLDLFVKVSQGIEAAHKGGVVHRDLKPQNIMVNGEGWPYVMDFGLAKALQTDSSLSVSGAIMGTPAYMPPEQAEGRLNDIDARSDVYSLGATMYAVFCRRPAFRGVTPLEILTQVCKETPAAPSSINPEIPPALEAIILKAMSKKSADRFGSVAEMTRALRDLLGTPSTPAPAPARGKGLWIGMAAALVLAGGVVAFLATRPEPAAQVSSPPAPPAEPVVRKPAEPESKIVVPSDLEGFKVEVPKTEEAPKTRPRQFPETPPPPPQEPVKPVAPPPSPAKTEEPKPKGFFTLKISVAPYAQIQKLTRDGKPVPFPKTETPIVMKNLELGVYTLELTHPDAGSRVVTVAARTDGKTWLISGNMEKAALAVTELP